MKRVVHRILELAANSVPGRVAATLGEESLSFIDAERRANRTARALAMLGAGHGERVLFWSAIGLRNLDVYFGTLRTGATFLSLNPDFSLEETAAMLEYVQPALLVVDLPRRDAGEALSRRFGIRLAVVDAGGRSVPGADLDALTAAASDGTLEADPAGEEDIEAMFLTSGSTGKPKGVMIPHRSTWVRSMELSTGITPACGGRGEVSMFPMFHFAGWMFLLQAWAFRRAVHLPTGTDADSLLSAVDRWQAGTLYCIPAVWERILASSKGYDTRSLRFVNTGTSRVEPDLLERLKARFPGTMTSVHYGSTEIGRGLSLGDDDLFRKPYSVGLPPQGIDAKIVEGELWLKSHTMMAGYFELPQQTAEVLKDGWYCSGDLVERDDEGYYTITGRRREIIRSGGETIAPAEVEAALRSFPGIADVAVVGLPDAKWGEVVCAAVVLSPGAALAHMDALRAHLAGSLAAFKHPRKVVAVEALPRTSATGQIQRSQVRDRILDLDGGR